MKPIEESKPIEEEKPVEAVKPVEEVKPMEAKTKPQEATPEQLLKMLDLQLAQMRQKRAVEPGNRNAIRVFSLCVIVFGAALALWVLMYMLDEMKPQKPGSPAAGSDAEVESVK